MADKESVRQQLYDRLESQLNSGMNATTLKTVAEAFAIVVETEDPPKATMRSR